MNTPPVTVEDACARAGRIFAAARRERDELAARGGPQAVADAAYVPGGPSKEEIAAAYERLRQQASGREKAA